MSILNEKDMQNIEMQMFNKARDIDVAIFNGIFSDMPREFIVDSLLMYQNNDGGFGGGLFIDNYNPESTVYVTYEALRMLYVSGFNSASKEEMFSGLVNKAMNYLYNKNQTVKNVWNHNKASNDTYAHSDFFTNKKENLVECGLYPSISIYALTLCLVPSTKAYYKKAMTGLKALLVDIINKDDLTKYELLSCGLVIEICNSLNIFKEEVDKLNSLALKSLQNEMDDDLFVFMANGLNLDEKLKDVLDEKLDGIINNRASHGLWEPFHKWGTMYPEEDSAKLKWIGYISWNYLSILKKYKKIA